MEVLVHSPVLFLKTTYLMYNNVLQINEQQLGEFVYRHQNNLFSDTSLTTLHSRLQYTATILAQSLTNI